MHPALADRGYCECSGKEKEDNDSKDSEANSMYSPQSTWKELKNARLDFLRLHVVSARLDRPMQGDVASIRPKPRVRIPVTLYCSALEWA